MSSEPTEPRRLLASAIKGWNLEYYVRRYAQGKLSMARAAHEARVSLWEFQVYARAHKIPSQYDREEFKHDVQTIVTA